MIIHIINVYCVTAAANVVSSCTRVPITVCYMYCKYCTSAVYCALHVIWISSSITWSYIYFCSVIYINITVANWPYLLQFFDESAARILVAFGAQITSARIDICYFCVDGFGNNQCSKVITCLFRYSINVTIIG